MEKTTKFKENIIISFIVYLCSDIIFYVFVLKDVNLLYKIPFIFYISSSEKSLLFVLINPNINKLIYLILLYFSINILIIYFINYIYNNYKTNDNSSRFFISYKEIKKL